MGPQGPKGDTGEKGADGSPIAVINVVESTEDGGENLVVLSDGSQLRIKNGKTGSKGDKGADGAQGPKGDKGDKGDKGEDGKSPIITTIPNENGYTISIQNADDTSQTINILNGKDGAPGIVTDEQIQEAIDGYFEENPVEVDTNVVGEILEFSQTAIPKTFEWKQGFINSSGVESDSDKWYRSDFVEVDTLFKYYLFVNNTTDTAQSVYYWLFDENKNLVGARITLVTDAYTQKEFIVGITGAKYIRFCVSPIVKDLLIRFYCKEQIAHTTKKELKQATYGKPRSLNMLDYFGANKKVVLIGDSFTQGLGSSEYVLYYKTDENGNTLTITGNGPDYGIEHNLPQYEIGKKLHIINDKIYYEAIDGNGYAQRLKNYLQNKFGCTVKNYGMSGITSGRLLSQEMTSQTSELVTADEGTVRVFQGLTKGFDTVFLTIGGNDRGIASIDAFVYNLNYIVNQLINTDHKKVILMSMTPCENDGEMPHPMSEIDAKISEIAETYSVPFVSCYNGMLEYCAETGVDIATLRKSDGLHPNDEGYAIVEAIICEQLGIAEVDKSYVDELVGSIDTALERIIEIQENLIGGVTE